MVKKHVLVCLLVFGLNSILEAQIKMDQLLNISLGETFSESKAKITSLFKKKAEILKGDFFGLYQINYTDVEFDYYGNASYTFQYAKDTLVAIQVTFSFIPADTTKFRRLYNTVIEDFATDKSKRFLRQISNLDKEKVIHYIQENARLTTEISDKDYKEIKPKYLGQNYWAILNDRSNSGKYICFEIKLTELHSFNREHKQFDGALIKATFEVANTKLGTLHERQEKLENYRYDQLDEN